MHKKIIDTFMKYVNALDSRLKQYDNIFKIIIKTSTIQTGNISKLEKRITDLELMLELQFENKENPTQKQQKNKKFLN